MQNKKEILREVRERIIKAYFDQKHPRDIARIFGCSITTVNRILKRYNQEGQETAKRRGGFRSSKLSDDHKIVIRSYIIENPTITLKAIRNKLEQDHNISVGKSTIERAIAKFAFSLKRVSLVPEARNTDNIIEMRYQYATNFYDYMVQEAGNDMYFLDEVGFNVSMRSRRGRSLVGTQAFITVQRLRSRNISICCVISREGPLHYKKQTHAFNTESFGCFINEVLEIFDQKVLKNRVFVMDNVRFHHSAEIIQLITSAGHKVLFLPAYSPFLNPIENMFAQWKQLVRSSNPLNETELLEIIDEKFNSISAEHCNNFFKHMLKNVKECLKKQEIYDN